MTTVVFAGLVVLNLAITLYGVRKAREARRISESNLRRALEARAEAATYWNLVQRAARR